MGPTLNNSFNEDLDTEDLYTVNTSKVANNVMKYGKGDRNKSPNIKSPWLNDLPSVNGNSPLNVRRVPKLKMPPPPLKTTIKNTRRRRNRKNRKTRRT
jgi:hypothetical protein